MDIILDYMTLRVIWWVLLGVLLIGFAIMDGADPDSGTCWEVGYAYGKKPIVLVRTDLRRNEGSGGSGYNPMLTQSATARVDAIAAPMDRVVRAVLDALAKLSEGS